MLFPEIIAAPDEVPKRVAPASIIASAVARSRIPPLALTSIVGGMEDFMRRTASMVAPAFEKPVEVLTNLAPAWAAA